MTDEMFSGQDGADVRAYCALARVDDGDSVEVVQGTGADGAPIILGIKVDCTILSGPFVTSQLAAILLAPLGATLPRPPTPGTKLMLLLPHGTPDRDVYAVASVPGGATTPLKAAVGGVDVSDPEKLAGAELDMPERGVNKITYLRGGTQVFRLKGKSSDFNAGFSVDADDGTTVRVAWNAATNSYGVKIIDSKGAFVQLCNGEISLQSPNALNGIYVTDEGIRIVAETFAANAAASATLDGGFVGLGLGSAVPVPLVNGALLGPGGVGPACTAAPSTRVFIGAA